jgi:FMN reductase
MHAVAISGSPRSPSKSKTLAEMMLRMLERGGCTTSVIDIATLPAAALLAREPSPAIDDAITAVGGAQIIVASTPTYRALYTGAMKCLFDLMPPAHLADKVCIPILTAASPAHFLAIEYGLKPLFASLEGLPSDGVYATDDQFADGTPNAKLIARIELVAGIALARACSG